MAALEVAGLEQAPAAPAAELVDHRATEVRPFVGDLAPLPVGPHPSERLGGGLLGLVGVAAHQPRDAQDRVVVGPVDVGVGGPVPAHQPARPALAGAVILGDPSAAFDIDITPPRRRGRPEGSSDAPEWLRADGEAHAEGLRLEAAGELVGEAEHEVGLELAVAGQAARGGDEGLLAEEDRVAAGPG